MADREKRIDEKIITVDLSLIHDMISMLEVEVASIRQGRHEKPIKLSRLKKLIGDAFIDINKLIDETNAMIVSRETHIKQDSGKPNFYEDLGIYAVEIKDNLERILREISAIV